MTDTERHERWLIDLDNEVKRLITQHPLDEPEGEPAPEVIRDVPNQHLQKQIDHLKSLVNHLERELNEHIDASKRKTKYNKYLS